MHLKRIINAVVTPLRKAVLYEPRIEIGGIWGDMWLTRGKYGIYVTVRGSYGAFTGSTWRLLESGDQFQNVMSPIRGGNEDTQNFYIFQPIAMKFGTDVKQVII